MLGGVTQQPVMLEEYLSEPRLSGLRNKYSDTVPQPDDR